MHYKRKSSWRSQFGERGTGSGEGAWERVVAKMPRGAWSWERFCWAQLAGARDGLGEGVKE